MAMLNWNDYRNQILARDKLPSLGIKVSRLRAGAAERGIALDSIAESLPISPTRARIWFR